MKHGKTIKIFLIDGDPNGRMTCELSNWTGKAYKIPRKHIKDCIDREDLNSPGVYLLFGKDEANKDLVYVGEAETIFSRLNQHLSQKDFWHEVIVFVSKDENLNKAHIKYLESRLYELAKGIDRYQVVNAVTPTRSAIAESDRSEMEEYVEYVRMLVSTLGHKVFDDKRELDNKSNVMISQETFALSTAGTISPERYAEAKGMITSDGFVVFKGSKAALTTVESITKGFVDRRMNLIENGILKLTGNAYEFTEDHIFNSPSTAAAIVLGRNANGLIEWRLSSGKTLKQFESIE